MNILAVTIFFGQGSIFRCVLFFFVRRHTPGRERERERGGGGGEKVRERELSVRK